MKRLGLLMASAALCGALVISDPADAYYRGFRGAGWHGGGWRGGGWHRGGWRGAGWRGAGWRGARWANPGWGWGGWGLGTGLGLAAATSPWWGGNYANYGYGYPYGYSAATEPVVAGAATTAPLVTGRSVATGPVQMGNYCTTPAKHWCVWPDSSLHPCYSCDR